MNISKRHLPNSGYCLLRIAESGLSDLSQLLQLRRRECRADPCRFAKDLAQEVLVAIFGEYQLAIAFQPVVVGVTRGRFQNRLTPAPMSTKLVPTDLIL
jgi:hypothetical protein